MCWCLHLSNTALMNYLKASTSSPNGRLWVVFSFYICVFSSYVYIFFCCLVTTYIYNSSNTVIHERWNALLHVHVCFKVGYVCNCLYTVGFVYYGGKTYTHLHTLFLLSYVLNQRKSWLCVNACEVLLTQTKRPVCFNVQFIL